MICRAVGCLALVAASLLAVVGCRSPVATGRVDNNRPYKVRVKGHVGMQQTVYVGEAAQHLDIQGRSHTHPVLLYMHGGPGRSALQTAHVYGGSLERRYVVAHWDQRGTQRSYSEEESVFPLSVDRLVTDTVELAAMLADWFKKERILLVAEGLAAVPAILAIKRHPERFFGLVLIAPVVDVQAAMVHGYQWLLDRAHDQEHRDALTALQGLGPPPWGPADELIARATLSLWLDRMGGTMPGKDAQIVHAEWVSQAAFARRLQVSAASLGEAHSLERLWPDLRDADLMRLAPSLDVPVFFVVGEADQRAPLAQIQPYYEALDARQGKTLVKLKGVGHWPLLEVPDRVMEVLAGRVRPLAQ